MEAQGNEEKAIIILERKARHVARRSGRAANVASSIVFTWRKVGALVEVNCETDFVARRDFRAFIVICLQVYANHSIYVKRCPGEHTGTGREILRTRPGMKVNRTCHRQDR